MPNKSTALYQTLKDVKEYCKEYCPELYEHPDYDAVVSHMIQSPNYDIPFVDKNIRIKILEYLTTIADNKKLHGSMISEGTSTYLPSQQKFDFFYESIPFPPPINPKFTFIDLFAGIGGIRIPFQKLGGKCVFSSEWDKMAQKTYMNNYGEIPYGDITKIDKSQVPEHNILLGGFPCQAFSIAGYRKGFEDEKGRGNLFFDIEDLILKKQPDAFLLENVKNLQGHDNGNTFRVITEKLHDAGYSVIANVLNTMDVANIPQNRERIYIVGFKGEANWKKMPKKRCKTSKFYWPEPVKLKTTVRDLLDKDVDEKYYYENYECYKQLKPVVTNKDTVYQWRRVYVRENKNNVCPTLTANMGTGGHNVPLILTDNNRIRKLTPKECSRIQGFPENFVLPDIGNSHLYKQFGNSVSVPVIAKIAHEMIRVLGY